MDRFGPISTPDQGTLCPSGIQGSQISGLADRDLEAEHEAGTDLSGELGVTKWVPEIPLPMSGELVPAPDLLRWIEIENAKRYPDVFAPGEPVVATEKIHGTACLFTFIAESGEGLVSSKGQGAKNLALTFSEDNLCWEAVSAHGVPEAARKVAERFGADRVAVFGEVFGSGVQDLAYGETGRSDRPGYVVFDIRLDVDGARTWIDAADLPALLEEVGMPTAPQVYNGPHGEAELLAAAQGKETWSGGACTCARVWWSGPHVSASPGSSEGARSPSSSPTPTSRARAAPSTSRPTEAAKALYRNAPVQALSTGSARPDQADEPVGITLMSFLLTNSWIPAAESSCP